MPNLTFVTNRKHKTDRRIRLIDDLNEVFSFISCNNEIGFDFETTGLDVPTLTPLLLVVANPTDGYVIDLWGYRNDEYFTTTIKTIFNGKTIIGHNLKFDYSIARYRLNIEFTDCIMYDTMLAAQRIYQGFDLSNDMINGIHFSLDSLLKFHKINEGKNTDVTMEFVGINPETFIYYNRHIQYTGNDGFYLFPLKEVLDKAMIKAKKTYLIQNIEMPLLTVLAQAEMTPLYLDEDGWKAHYYKQLDALYETEVALDKWVITLRDRKFPPSSKIEGHLAKRLALSDNQYTRERVKNFHKPMVGLFGWELNNQCQYGKKAKPEFNQGNTDWNSSTEITKVFAKLELTAPVVTRDGKGREIGQGYSIPRLDRLGKVIKYPDESFSFSKKKLDKYLIDFPDIDYAEFIKLLEKHSSLVTLLSGFGLNFIQKINPVTGGIHTIFRQCRATNGRLQSGDRKNQPDKYNCQNIPANNDYRNLFKVNKPGEDRYIMIGADLVGAEAVIMGDKARDTEFLKHRDDPHSFLATMCWRAIYNYRYKTTNSQEYLELSKTFTVSKTENLPYRKKQKAVTFGIPYGAGPRTVASAMNLPIEEAEVIINAYNLAIPKIMELMKKTYQFALWNGYVILNNRTNSSIFLPGILATIKQRTKEGKTYNPYTDLPAIYRKQAEATRNLIISGTQADALKEAMVVMDKEIKNQGKDGAIILQIHDEIQTKVLREYQETPTLILPKTKEIVTASKWIEEMMLDTCNRYLSISKFGVETSIADCWVK